MNNYSPLVIRRNYKNKQLTLLGQHKLALTIINKLSLHYKILGAPKKFKNQPHSLDRLSSVNFGQNFFNVSGQA
jgi:hypothetical protein